MDIIAGELNITISRKINKETLKESIILNIKQDGNINVYSQIGAIDRILEHLKETAKISNNHDQIIHK